MRAGAARMDTHVRAHTVLNQLLPELQAFLILLDDEKLSPFAQAQKRSISDLLTRLQDPPAEDTEYMVMNCPLESNSDSQGCRPPNAGGLLCSTAQVSHHLKEPFSSPCAAEGLPRASLSPANPSAVSLGSSQYEGAEPVPTSGEASNNGSLHELYDNKEKEEGGSVKDCAHYLEWMASQSCLHPPKQSHLWGFLWRRRWLGQWNKQLFIIWQHLLLCYRCPWDLRPVLEMSLEGCQVSCRSKPSSKVPFQLKVVAASQTLVLGFHSWLQTQEWRKVIEEVSRCDHSDGTSLNSWSLFDSDGQGSRRSSTGSPTVSSEDQHSDLPSSGRQKTDGQGFLNVFMHCQWQSLWCQLQGGALRMFRDQNSKTGPQYCLRLPGCQVQTGEDGKGAHRITVTQHGEQVAILEASTKIEGQRWLHLLQERSVAAKYGAANTMLRSLKTHTSPSPNEVCEPIRPHPFYCYTSEVQTSKSVAPGDPVHPEDLNHYSDVHSGVFFCSIAGVAGGVASDLESVSRRQRLLGPRMRFESDLLEVKGQSRSTPFRHSLAFCTNRAQGVWLNLMRRTTTTKNSLKRTPPPGRGDAGIILTKPSP